MSTRVLPPRYAVLWAALVKAGPDALVWHGILKGEQAQAGRRLVRGDKRCGHALHLDALLDSGQHDAHDHGRHHGIMGVGSLRRLSAVKWGVAGRIVWAWVLTVPCSAAIAAAAYLLIRLR